MKSKMTTRNRRNTKIDAKTSIDDTPTPKIFLTQGESKIHKKETITNLGKGIMSCSCKKWATLSDKDMSTATCTHIRDLVGDEYEDHRISSQETSASENAKASVPKSGEKRSKR